MKPIYAIIGDTRIDAASPQAEILRGTARMCIRLGGRIQTGGLGDLPRIVAEAARAEPGWSDGDLIALVPGFDPARGHADVVIPTGIDLLRNALVANADVVIAIGGGAGTLSEMALAWQLNRPIVAWTGAGWSARLAGTAIDHRREDRISSFSTSEEIEELLHSLPLDRSRHVGIREGAAVADSTRAVQAPGAR